MVESKYGVSPYHQIHAIYTRDATGALLSIFGHAASEVQSSWPHFWQQLSALRESEKRKSPKASDQSLSAYEVVVDDNFIQRYQCLEATESPSSVEIYETKLSQENQYRGLIKLSKKYHNESADNGVTEWAINLVLRNSRLSHCENPSVEDQTAIQLAESITTLFSATLRNIAYGDQWDACGRDYFKERVLLFTSRQARIDLILPAFPCKSTSKEKVAGASPDKGEELALRSLFGFVKDVEGIYSPGARVLIVSDGHVFSDCIGADDTVVDTYGNQLIQMKNSLFGVEANKIDFLGLPALFNLEQLRYPCEQQLNKIELPNYVGTRQTAEADVCRKLLIMCCGIEEGPLRQKIENGDKASLALYRGFSRFMFEDLCDHPFMANKSKAQKKKLGSKVAFEMLKRNQAYSNLVELIFPSHVRLSIHAHINSGPKFGINLLGRFNCRSTASLLNWDSERSDDLLHIPTPWHNSMVKIDGTSGFLVVKASVIKEAEESGKYVSDWVPTKNGNGGYFLLRSTQVSTLEPSTPRFESLGPEKPQKTIETLTQSLEKEGRWSYWELMGLLFHRMWHYVGGNIRLL